MTKTVTINFVDEKNTRTLLPPNIPKNFSIPTFRMNFWKYSVFTLMRNSNNKHLKLFLITTFKIIKILPFLKMENV